MSTYVTSKPIPHTKLYLEYGLAYVNRSQSIPWVQLGCNLSTNQYPGYGLAVINVCQTKPWVQFRYDLHTSKHTLDNVNFGYGLAVTPATLTIRKCTYSTQK